MATCYRADPELPARVDFSKQARIADASVTVTGPVSKCYTDVGSGERPVRQTPIRAPEHVRSRNFCNHAASNGAGYCHDVDAVATTDVDDHGVPAEDDVESSTQMSVAIAPALAYDSISHVCMLPRAAVMVPRPRLVRQKVKFYDGFWRRRDTWRIG